MNLIRQCVIGVMSAITIGSYNEYNINKKINCNNVNQDLHYKYLIDKIDKMDKIESQSILDINEIKQNQRKLEMTKIKDMDEIKDKFKKIDQQLSLLNFRRQIIEGFRVK